MNPKDPLSRVLYIDLTRQSFDIRDREDLFNRHLGGAGVAIELLHEECPQGADLLAPTIRSFSPLAR